MDNYVSSFSRQSEQIWKSGNVSLKQFSPDFSVSSESRIYPKSKSLCRILRHFPKAILQAGMYVCTRLFMTALYPAQSKVLSLIKNDYSASHLDSIRISALERLVSQGYAVYRVILKKNSEKYDGLVVRRNDALDERKWILQATGCSAPIESSIEDIAKIYLNHGTFSLLMVNGPAVGRSQGQATFQSLANTQEIAIRFLEKNQKATHIALIGHSFGAAILGLAIMNHRFVGHIKYTVVRQMAFNSLPEIAKTVTRSPLAALVIQKLHLNIDNVESSAFLEKQGIHEIIIQASKEKGTPEKVEDFAADGVIPERNSLGASIVTQHWKHKTFVGLGPVGHADTAVWETTIKFLMNS